MNTSTTDPRNLTVQLQVRVPFWYKQQLAREARKRGVSVPALIRESVQQIVIPEPPR